MKISPVMLGIGKLFGVLFLILHLGIWSIDGGEPCHPEIRIRRNFERNILAGDPFDLECPVEYCANQPKVTWCKFKGESCPPLGERHERNMKWIMDQNTPVYRLHFDQALATDNGSYRCSMNVSSELYESHAITVYVIEQIQNNSEPPPRIVTNISDTTSASGPPSKSKIVDKQLILYSLLPLGGLLVLGTCFYLFCCLRRHQGTQKKPSDTAQRGINPADVPQPFRSEQTEVGSRQNPQNVSLETEVYDNDPWFQAQEEPVIYSNPCLEGSKQGIVYASLNHSRIEVNPGQSRSKKEAPTEYAAICVRS